MKRLLLIFLSTLTLSATILSCGIHTSTRHTNSRYAIGNSANTNTTRSSTPENSTQLTSNRLPTPSSRPYTDYDFSEIDRHARQSPDRLESSPEELASYLVEPAQNDVEKARAIFIWIVDNIAYDTESYFSGDISNVNPEQVLEDGKAVCSGYSGVFEMLAKYTGLEVVTISGYGKGYGYTEEDKIEGTNHAWNAVKLNGKWHLLDPTWAAGGYSKRKGEWTRKFDDSYFMAPPLAFAFSHFPEQKKWQLLENPLTRQQFQRYPNLEPSFFKMGFSPEKARSLLKENPDMKFPELYTFSGDIDIHLKKATLQGELNSDKTYQFALESADISMAAFVNNGEFTFLKPDSNLFKGQISPNEGKMGVYVLPKDTGDDENYSAIIQYVVE